MKDAFLLLIVLLVLLFAANLYMGLGGNRVPQVRAKPMMTLNEIAFWQLLRRAAAPLLVCPQVGMNALLTTERGMDGKARQATRNRFMSKIVDFVLIENDGTVRLIVELDDSTHDAARDKKRDLMTARAGYTTLRIRRPDSQNVAEIKRLVADALG